MQTGKNVKSEVFYSLINNGNGADYLRCLDIDKKASYRAWYDVYIHMFDSQISNLFARIWCLHYLHFLGLRRKTAK